MSYADGYVGQWEDYLAMMEPAISAVPLLIAEGNHESGRAPRDALRHASCVACRRSPLISPSRRRNTICLSLLHP